MKLSLDNLCFCLARGRFQLRSHEERLVATQLSRCLCFFSKKTSTRKIVLLQFFWSLSGAQLVLAFLATIGQLTCHPRTFEHTLYLFSATMDPEARGSTDSNMSDKTCLPWMKTKTDRSIVHTNLTVLLVSFLDGFWLIRSEQCTQVLAVCAAVYFCLFLSDASVGWPSHAADSHIKCLVPCLFLR